MGAAVQPLNGRAPSCSTIERPQPKNAGSPKSQGNKILQLAQNIIYSIGASIRIR